jgi:uncharacterized protein YndB with AHSA1/START domain
MTEAQSTNELVIHRIFDAPRALVYRAFTDPDQIAAWFGPVGWSVPRETVSVDPRPGGEQRFVMVNDADPEMRSPAVGRFTEVVENELLVGTEDVATGSGPASGAMYLRLEFHDEGGNKTRLVLRQGPYAPEIESQARDGWNSSFTKLDALLAR